MAKSKKLKLPNPWKIGAQIGTAINCRQHTKYTCKTSPAETSNPNPHGTN